MDFDDVIGDSHILKVEKARELFDVSIEPSLCRKGHVIRGGILTKEQYREVQKAAFLAPVPGFVEGAELYMRLLRGLGHELSIVTARSDEALVSAAEFAAAQCPGIPMTGVGYGNTKAEACRGLDVFFDDDAETLSKLVGVVPHLFLHDRIFNQNDLVPEGIARVTWFRFYDEVRQIAERG